MKIGMCHIPLCLASYYSSFKVCDIMKRHTENKNTHVCIEMYGVAHFLELISSEGPW